MTVTERRVYNLFDLFADLGGFFVAISKLFQIFSSLFSMNIVYFVLTPILFDIKRKTQASDSS